MTDLQRAQITEVEELVRRMVIQWYGGRFPAQVVEEMEQAALLALCKALPCYNPAKSSFHTWAVHVAKGACRHWFRDSYEIIRIPAWRWAGNGDGERPRCFLYLDYAADYQLLVVSADEYEALMAVLMERMSTMTTRQQAVFRLCYVEERNQSEAARVMGVSQMTVSREKQRIRAALTLYLRRRREIEQAVTY